MKQFSAIIAACFGPMLLQILVYGASAYVAISLGIWCLRHFGVLH